MVSDSDAMDNKGPEFGAFRISHFPLLSEKLDNVETMNYLKFMPSHMPHSTSPSNELINPSGINSLKGFWGTSAKELLETTIPYVQIMSSPTSSKISLLDSLGPHVRPEREMRKMGKKKGLAEWLGIQDPILVEGDVKLGKRPLVTRSLLIGLLSLYHR